MPEFNQESSYQLDTCDPQIGLVFRRVILVFDCTIIEGGRLAPRQNMLYRTGKSQLQWPASKHSVSRNKRDQKRGIPALSRAVDVMPYPIDWNDRERVTLFAGFVLGTAEEMEIDLRWGGDWNRDWKVADNHFDDLGHYELA